MCSPSSSVRSSFSRYSLSPLKPFVACLQMGRLRSARQLHTAGRLTDQFSRTEFGNSDPGSATFTFKRNITHSPRRDISRDIPPDVGMYIPSRSPLIPLNDAGCRLTITMVSQLLVTERKIAYIGCEIWFKWNDFGWYFEWNDCGLFEHFIIKISMQRC